MNFKYTCVVGKQFTLFLHHRATKKGKISNGGGSSTGCFCFNHCSRIFLFCVARTWNKYLQIFEEEKEIFLKLYMSLFKN